MLVSCKPKKNSGQVSVETLVAIFILLIFFVIVLIQASLINSSGEIAESAFSERNSCLKFSHLISQVYTEGKGSHATFYLDYPVRVFANERVVQVNEQFCYFIAITQDANLVVGEVEIDNNSIVRFLQ